MNDALGKLRRRNREIQQRDSALSAELARTREVVAIGVGAGPRDLPGPDADVIGIELAARAGYDPRAAITLWQKMAQAGGGGTPEWLSTHPSHDTRQRELQAQVQKVLPLYVRSRAGR